MKNLMLGLLMAFAANVAMAASVDTVQTIPLATALDTSLSFTTGGDVSWFGQTVVAHDGANAAQSGAIGDNQNSWMQTTVTGPGIISFWWYASSEDERYDYLEFSIDNIQQARTGGTSGTWEKCSYLIEDGSHTLKWNYTKDGSLGGGLDAGFVDQVEWTDNIVTDVKDLGVKSVSGDNIFALVLRDGRQISFPDSWLTGAGISILDGITPSIMNTIGRNGLPRYQSYLLGLAPESPIPAKEQVEQMTWEVGAVAAKCDGKTINEADYLYACACYGLTAKPKPMDPKLVQEDEIAVKKESIAAPSAGTVKVEDGKVQLGVAVLKTSDLTAEKKDWSKVKLTKDDIEVDADGNIIVNVPVDSQSGFMVIQTKDAKIKD